MTPNYSIPPNFVSNIHPRLPRDGLTTDFIRTRLQPLDMRAKLLNNKPTNRANALPSFDVQGAGIRMAWDIAGLHINQCAEFRGRRRNNSALLRVVLVRQRFTVRYGLVECWRSRQKRRQQLGKRSTDERSRCGRRSSSAHFRTVSPTGMRRWWSGEAGSRQPGQPARTR